MNGHDNKRYRLVSIALALGLLALMGGAALAKTSSSGGTGGVVYNAIPSHLPGSVSSIGFEATGTAEFGDQVILGPGGRNLQSMSVVLVSWGCEDGHWTTFDCVTTPGATFPVDLTFNVYEDNGDGVVPDTLIATQTKPVNVQYRPSANNAKCTGANRGKWYSKTDHTCYNGFAQTFKASFTSGVLTEGAIWSVAYNTTHYGYAPYGELTECYTTSGGCGYDSLNVGTFSATNAPYVGTDKVEAEAFRCDSAHVCAMEGVAGDPYNDYTGYRPLGSISATK